MKSKIVPDSVKLLQILVYLHHQQISKTVFQNILQNINTDHNNFGSLYYQTEGEP